VRIESMSSEPVLLPVWIMAYRYGDRLYRFLLNGQSGRATGGAPVSWTKILLVGAAVVLLALVLLGVVASMATGGEVGRNPGGNHGSPTEATAADSPHLCYTAPALKSRFAVLECGDSSPLSKLGEPRGPSGHRPDAATFGGRGSPQERR